MKYTLRRSIRRNPTECLPDLFGWLRLRAEPELWRNLAEVSAKSLSVGCPYEGLSMLFLHVVKRRPARVLELGAGLSTLVLAHAARKVRDLGLPCTIISMEEHPFYYEQLKQLLPSRVSDCVELILSLVEERSIAGRIARRYTAKARHVYDRVFIDGPQVPKNRDFFDGDILDAISWNDNAFTAFIDGRGPTRANLIRLCPWIAVTPGKEFTRLDNPELALRC